MLPWPTKHHFQPHQITPCKVLESFITVLTVLTDWSQLQNPELAEQEPHGVRLNIIRLLFTTSPRATNPLQVFSGTHRELGIFLFVISGQAVAEHARGDRCFCHRQHGFPQDSVPERICLEWHYKDVVSTIMLPHTIQSIHTRSSLVLWSWSNS